MILRLELRLSNFEFWYKEWNQHFWDPSLDIETGIETQKQGGIPVIEVLARVTAHLWGPDSNKLDGVSPLIKDPPQNSLPFCQKEEEKKKKKSLDMWYVMCDMWHMTNDTWRVTHDRLGEVNHLSKIWEYALKIFAQRMTQ